MQQAANGTLKKMISRLEAPVRYALPVGEQELPLNEQLGKTIRLEFSGAIFCTHCGRKTKKSFNQGYCFPCFKRLAQCDSCIMSPEKCHFSQGTCREPAWGEANCMIPHYVYLANSSGLKVGITRTTQVPTRWIDQGASQALPIYEVSTRRFSGLAEDLLRTLMTDRTNWRVMLKGTPEPLDLAQHRDQLQSQFAAQLQSVAEAENNEIRFEADAETVELQYPVLQYPLKVTSLNPEKNPVVSGTLLGIKGQYLILDTGCINIRKFTAYEVSVSME